MNRREACSTLAAAGLLAGVACTRTPSGAATPPSLLISGAAAMLPLATALAQSFARAHRPPGVNVLVERGGSLPAYIAASRGAIDLAAMTRALSDSEDDAGAHHYLVARDHIGILAHPALPLRSLAREQVRALLRGEIASWRTLGGPDLPVTVYAHARGATARQSAESLLLDGADLGVDARECASDAALAAAVAADPGAIGYLDGRARAAIAQAGQPGLLAIDGVQPTHATVLSGRYPYTHSFHLLLHGDSGGARAGFVRFVRSAAGQAIVAGLGFTSVC